MKPATIDRTVISSPPMNSGKFGISAKNTGHVLSILRDRLYTNKIMAVLREYSTNAWDAQIEAGNPEVPFKVVLPTDMEPTLRIRDYGAGLSEEAVFTVYTQYGDSTKRESNSVAGMLGIGSKSAFAYSDAFTVTSWHGGKKCIYTAVLDESNIGQMAKDWEEDSDEPSGVEIKVAVDPKDVREFWKEAKRLYTWFEVRPVLNIPMEYPSLTESFRTDEGVIFYQDQENAVYGGWLAKMGCVTYRLNFDRITARPDFEKYVSLIQRMRFGALFFDIGEVDVAASREELEYTERTKLAIIQKLGKLNDTIATRTLEKLDSLASGWKQRLWVRDAQEKMPFGIPENYATYNRREIPLYTLIRDDNAASPLFGTTTRDVSCFELRKFRWTNERVGDRIKRVGSTGETQTITVDPYVKLILIDCKTPIGRFEFSEKSTYFIKPLIDDLDKVRKELEEALLRTGLDGLPVGLLSELPQEEKATRAVRPHYKHSLFRWNMSTNTADRASDRWDLVEDMPEDGVFVVISGFLPYGEKVPSMADMQQFQECVTRLLGEEPTEIYGLKTTVKHPIDESKVVGIPYAEWRKAALARLLALPGLAEEIRMKRFAGNYSDIGREICDAFKNSGDPKYVAAMQGRRTAVEAMDRLLKDSHSIVRFFADCMDSWKAYNKQNKTERGLALAFLDSHVPWTNPLDELYEQYPLLQARYYNHGGISSLIGDRYSDYLTYVVALDKLQGE